MAEVTRNGLTYNRLAAAPLSLRLAVRMASMLPRGTLAPLASVAGRIQYHAAPGKRIARRHNLAQVSKMEANSRPWRAFQLHCHNVLELLRALERPSAAAERVRLTGTAYLDNALAGGRGLILATLHMGNWELSGLSLAAAGYPLTTVAGEQLRAGWSHELKRFKQRCGIATVTPNDSVRKLHRDLAANRLLVLHLDGDIHDGGVQTTLLGRSVRVPRGPAALARIMHAPVAFAFCRRLVGGNFEVIIEDPCAPPRTRDEERALTVRLTKRMEKCIVEAPDEWCIFRQL